VIPVVQSSSSKHILPTDLKKCKTVAHFILPLLKKWKSKVWYKKQRMGVNKIDSFMKNMALEAELDVEGRKLTSHSVRKTVVKKLKVSNQPRSAIISVTGYTSEQTTRKVTKQNSDRFHPSSALLSANRFRIPAQFFPICPFSTSVQRRQPAKQ